MLNKLLISVIVLPTIILAGCTTTPRYQAKATNRSDGAVVSSWTSGTFMFFIYTEIEKVDGLRSSACPQVSSGWLVDPGLRVLSVAGTYAGWSPGRDTGRVELDVPLKAGHTYLVKAERNGENMTLWVEDKETHEVVGEKRSTKTTHWIKWL